jgi:hypothetical protein
MKLKLRAILSILIMLWAMNLLAVEAQLSVKHKSNLLTVSNINLPIDMLLSDLDSGLPNTISVIIRVTKNNTVLEKRMINTEITYDLWDEVYNVNTANSFGLIRKKYKLKSNVIESLKYAALSDMKLLDLKGMTIRNFDVSIQTIYNPIEQAKIKKIQDWIMSSNGYSESGSFEVSLKKGDALKVNAKGLRFQRLFEKLVENYVQEEDFTAQWKSKVALVPVYVGKH